MGAAGFRAASLALLCSGCTSIHATQATFEGTEWRIVAVNGAPAPSYSSVGFNHGFISGLICNNFRGPYSVGGGLLHLGGLENTERGCDGPIMQIEESAFAILHRRPIRMSWYSGRRLRLSNAAGSIDLQRLSP